MAGSKPLIKKKIEKIKTDILVCTFLSWSGKVFLNALFLTSLHSFLCGSLCWTFLTTFYGQYFSQYYTYVISFQGVVQLGGLVLSSPW